MTTLSATLRACLEAAERAPLVRTRSVHGQPVYRSADKPGKRGSQFSPRSVIELERRGLLAPNEVALYCAPTMRITAAGFAALRDLRRKERAALRIREHVGCRSQPGE